MSERRSTMREEVAGMRVTLGNMDEKLDKCVAFIDGNGKPGAKVRIDRLERSNRNKNRVLWGLFSLSLAIIGAVVQSYLTK